jgi:penicillin V acylase-like amidase (Ntn superfamily)
MKTSNYNPSILEVRLALILKEMREEINARMDGFKIFKIEDHPDKDNPDLHFHIEDSDGDRHVLVLKLIQKPDRSGG